jgi:phosphoserine phosphatase RsbU/P
MKILIAEDDFTSRTVLTGVLKRSGHEVIEMLNGKDAWLELQKPGAPGLAILDWMMPEMDGLEVLQRVRRQESDRQPYIIMLTARWEKTDIIRVLDNGANDYIVKPFDVGELRARIEVGRRMVEMQDALAAKIGELRKAFDEIKTLRGIVPICMNCKKIRDDMGFWNQVDVYVHEHTEAEISHGFCPECMRKVYPEYEDIISGTV